MMEDNMASGDSVNESKYKNNSEDGHEYPYLMHENSGSDIQEFYRGANILITGGTGFIGKVLIEKLLRSCENLNSIYLLVRSKKGKDADRRLQELLQEPLFDKLNAEYPNFKEKLHIVSGDCLQPNLGLSSDDRERIQKHVNIVFHVAAVVKLHEKLHTVIPVHVRATRDLLLICRECHNLKVVMFVSTAYCQSYRLDLEERLYETPLTCDAVIKLAEDISEDILDKITPKLVGDWPNTYTFTKAIAEDTVRRYGTGLPVGILRPSAVVNTRRDPVSGWIDNLNGTTGGIVAAIAGMLKTTLVNENCVIDIVPCDMVVSALIAATWDIHNRKRVGNEDIRVYNYVSSCENPITYGKYLSEMRKYSSEEPYNAYWMLTIGKTRKYFMYRLYRLILHIVPAILIDLIFLSKGQKPMMRKRYEKLHSYLENVSYFTLNQWEFSNHNVQQLWKRMNDKDRKTFDFDVKNINWNVFLKSSVDGIYTYMLKDDIKTISDNSYKLYCIHQMIMMTLISLFLFLCWVIFISIL